MNYEPINHHDPTEVAIRIKQLKELNLTDITLNDAKKNLKVALPMSYNTFLQEPGHHVYRGRVNDADEPYTSISRISYNPNPSKSSQRASLPGDIVFYASNGLSIVAREAIQDEYRRTEEKLFYLTVGKWKIVEPLNLMLICYSKMALEAGTDIAKALPGLERHMRQKENYNDTQIQAWLMRSEFLADEFAKNIITCE